MSVRQVAAAIIFLTAGCAITPNELRQTEPHLTATLPSQHAEAARCVARAFENKGSAMISSLPVEIRDFPAEGISELISRRGTVLTFIVEFRRSGADAGMRMFYRPAVFGGATPLERMAESVLECGGRILTKTQL